MNRLFGVAVMLLWGAAMFALVRRDVLPYWQAAQPPRGAIPHGRLQSGIYLDERRVGVSQVITRRSGQMTHVRSRTMLDLSRLRLPALPLLPAALFDTEMSFDDEEVLQEFKTEVFGMHGLTIRVSGSLLGIDYSCQAQFGEARHGFSIDARLSQQVTEALRPFTQLSNLEVGQTWQIQMLDPASLLTGTTANVRPMLVRVGGKDRIEHEGVARECFRIEADRATAWADEAGRVLVQVVDLPLIGKITVRDETFDDELAGRVFRPIMETARPRGRRGERE